MISSLFNNSSVAAANAGDGASALMIEVLFWGLIFWTCLQKERDPSRTLWLRGKKRSTGIESRTLISHRIKPNRFKTYLVTATKTH